MKTFRNILKIHSAPSPHWVGNGFLVNPMFNHQMADKRTDPFLMLDYASTQKYESNSGEPRGVGSHPHKGFETVTIAYKGEVAHKDSSGGGGVIKKGDVQWMTAGGGVIHQEFHSPEFSKRGGDFEMVQLWVNLPAKDKTTAANYQLLTSDAIATISLSDENGSTVGKMRLIAGDYDEKKGLAKTFTPINLWDIYLEAGKTAELSIPKNHNLLLLVREGEVIINGEEKNQAGAKQLITFESEKNIEGKDYIKLTTQEKPASILLMSGEPIDEEIAAYGPFVMNTQEELRRAISDFNSGKFGNI